MTVGHMFASNMCILNKMADTLYNSLKCQKYHVNVWAMGWMTKDSFRAFYMGVKQPGCEDDHTFPSSAKAKNVELNLHSAICFHGMHRSIRHPF